jgi:hypothetical protein
LIGDFQDCQENRFHDSFTARIRELAPGVLSDFSTEVFGDVAGVDDLSDFQGESQESGELFAIVFPAFDGTSVLPCPFGFKLIQNELSGFMIGGGADFQQVGREWSYHQCYPTDLTSYSPLFRWIDGLNQR